MMTKIFPCRCGPEIQKKTHLFKKTIVPCHWLWLLSNTCNEVIILEMFRSTVWFGWPVWNISILQMTKNILLTSNPFMYRLLLRLWLLGTCNTTDATAGAGVPYLSGASYFTLVYVGLVLFQLFQLSFWSTLIVFCFILLAMTWHETVFWMNDLCLPLRYLYIFYWSSTIF